MHCTEALNQGDEWERESNPCSTHQAWTGRVCRGEGPLFLTGRHPSACHALSTARLCLLRGASFSECSAQSSGAPFFFFKIIYLFIYFWLCWVFVAALWFSLVVASGGSSSLRCASFSLQWLLLLRSTGSRHTGFSSCGSRALEHRLSSCGAQV